MGIKIGNTDISKIKIGGTDVEKLYLGSELIWEKETPILYTEVQYIESTGTQYIDSGRYPTTDYCKVELDAYVSGSGAFFGENTSGKAIGLSYYGTIKWSAGDGKDISTGMSYNGGDTVLTYIANNKAVSWDVNGTTGSSSYITTIVGTQNMNIFAFNFQGITTGYINMQLRSMKIYSDASTLVRDFVPCYRNSDGEIGLLDNVEGVFYTNAGTGTFTKGPDVN